MTEDFVKLLGNQTVTLMINFHGQSSLGIGSTFTPKEYIGHNKSLVDTNIQNLGYEPYIKSVWDMNIRLLLGII